MGININIDAKETFKHILGKLSSGRWIVTVFLTGTFCYICVKLVNIFILNIGTDKLPVIEKILMFVLGAFVTQLANVVTGYFRREDRATENGKGEVK